MGNQLFAARSPFSAHSRLKHAVLVVWLGGASLLAACDEEPTSGEACECSVESGCCDGCLAINEGGDCDDGLFCNGTESCQGGSCQIGTAPTLDDGVGCTDDSCDEVGDLVVNTANDANCDNGQFCDGAESCDAVNGCQTGTPPCPGPDNDDDCFESCRETPIADCSGYDGDGTLCELDAAACSREICSGDACVVERSCTFFVDDDAIGAGTGLSWVDAFTTVQDGVDAAAAESPSNLFVAAGTYLSNDGTAAVLTMASNVQVYGSFDTSEDLLAERDVPPLHNSVLDGEGIVPKVVIGASDALLDGFTVTNANNTSDGLGGGMYNAGISNLTISEVTFSANSVSGVASAHGGGMYSESVDGLTLSHVTFSNNAATGSSYGRGGGMHNDSVTNFTMTHVTFSANAAVGYYPHGGGLYNQDSNPTLTDVTFADNVAQGTSSGTGCGGGMMNLRSDAVLSNVTFTNNSVAGDIGEGGGLCNYQSRPILTDVSFVGNTTLCTFGEGGGMYNSGSPSTLTNVIFDSNRLEGSDMLKGAGISSWSSALSLTNVTFVRNSLVSLVEGDGGGMYNSRGALSLTDVSFIENSIEAGWTPKGGGMYKKGGTLTLTRVGFIGNSIVGDQAFGGGMYNENVADLTLSNVEFANNAIAAAGGARLASACGGGLDSRASNATLSDVSFTANRVFAAISGGGGGMCNRAGSSATLTEVSFLDNVANASNSASGGGLHNHGSDLTLTDVTFSRNVASGSYGYGGGIYNMDGNLTLTDVTFAGNTAAGSSSSSGGAISSILSSTTIATNIDIAHCNFYGNSPDAFSLLYSAISQTTIVNSVFYGNNGRDIVRELPTSVTHTCSEGSVAGTGNQTLSSDPFVTTASGELFLDQTSLCINNGDNTAADGAYGTDVWRGMSTELNGAIEGTSTVDMGVHRDPADAWIKTFAVDAGNVTWTTHAPAGGVCTVTGEGFSYDVPDGDRAGGSTTHSLASGVQLTILCSSAGGKGSDASAVVP